MLDRSDNRRDTDGFNLYIWARNVDHAYLLHFPHSWGKFLDIEKANRKFSGWL